MPNHIQYAVGFLVRNGYEIIERNAKPHPFDGRARIDIVALERQSDTMVFVDVDAHAKMSRRIRLVGLERRNLLRRAAFWWCRVNKWSGDSRLDCIDIYGDRDCEHPVIEHTKGVRTTK